MYPQIGQNKFVKPVDNRKRKQISTSEIVIPESEAKQQAKTGR